MHAEKVDSLAGERTQDANGYEIVIEPHYKLEKITKVSVQNLRENISNIKLDKTRRFGNCAVATNGRSLAVVPVEGEHDCGLISPKSLVASRKPNGGKGKLILNGDIRTINGNGFPRPYFNGNELGYPNWQQMLPEGKFKFTIALNPRLLLELAQAIGSDNGIRLDFIDEMSPVTVTSNQSGGRGFGVLMPMRIGN